MTQEEFFKRYTYNIRTDRIGGGGFGNVYKANDNLAHRVVAIKVSEVKTAANGKTFSLKDEFNALKGLPMHPNIANYEDLFTFDTPQGVFDYAVMQYYPDGNLTQVIGPGLTTEQKEGIADQLLEGIAFLHEHKVVHRDLKPGNILVVKQDSHIIPIITDFGLSKTADTGDRSMFSNSFGGGTARYSSPEQLQGRPLRMNTDLWSYGAVVYELFAGQPLFEAGSSAANSAQADLEIYNKIINGDVGGRLGDMPEKWRKVLERCLVVDPEKRAKNAADLRALLNNVSDSNLQENPTVVEDKTFVEATIQDRTEPVIPVQSKRPKPSAPAHKQPSVPKQPATPTPSRKRLPWIIGGATAVVILAVVLGVTLGKGKKEKPVDETNPIAEGVSVILSTDVKALAQTYTVNGVPFAMKYVEGGTFQMGAKGKDASPNEKPVHEVTVSDFCIGETEVTQALWKAVMDNNPSHYKGDDLPVENVSWEDCQKFIQKLNQLTGKTFRLPTEAEWEYAARGGNKSKGYKQSGGENINDVAWYTNTTHDRGTKTVKTKKANELGLYDMSGNVLEWCSDWYGDYSSSSQTNPTSSSSGSYRVLRGGSWSYLAKFCRVATRNYDDPASRSDEIGFRLVLVR